MCLLPAEPDFGLRYALGCARRGTVVLTSVPVPATLTAAVNRDRCLCLERDGLRITNIEHLNAVLVAYGLDNAIVVLEKRGTWPRLFHRQALPLLEDGTAGFVEAIDAVGMREQAEPRRMRTVAEAFELCDAKRGDTVRVEPGPGLVVTCTSGYEGLGVETRTLRFAVSAEAYRDEISRARTLMNQYARLPLPLIRWGARFAYPRYGLGTGVSEASMLILERGSLRGDALYGGVAEEFVRHKIMDFLGAVALLGPVAECHFTVVKSSHRHDLAFMRALAERLRPYRPSVT